MFVGCLLMKVIIFISLSISILSTCLSFTFVIGNLSRSALSGLLDCHRKPEVSLLKLGKNLMSSLLSPIQNSLLNSETPTSPLQMDPPQSVIGQYTEPLIVFRFIFITQGTPSSKTTFSWPLANPH